MHRKSFVLAMTLLAAFLFHGQQLSAAAAAGPPSIDEVMKRLGYTDEDKKALLSGKIVSTDLKRTRDDQLIAAVAVRVATPISTLAENVKRGRNIELDPETLAFGLLADPGGGERFAQAAYAASETEEVNKLLKVKASSTFNLSSAEIAFLRGRLKGIGGGDVEAVSKAYREVLAGRLEAYLEKGLEGIAPYDHGGESLSPAKELRAVYGQAKPFLAEYFPAFDRALAAFPEAPSPEVSSQVYWMKRDVEGRPAFILAHQLVQAGEDYVLMSQRQFFVGHTYDSLQVVALALPVEEGAAIFYVNSAFTDKITGFMSGVARSVGQGRVREDLTKYFKIIREQASQ